MNSSELDPPADDRIRDVVIVGGGPAGLTSAVYLGRFLRDVVVIDGGDGRARLIPRSHNCPGFPDGISGNDLLARLEAQAAAYGAEIIKGQVGALEPLPEGFAVSIGDVVLRARKIVLATGIVDNLPDIPNLREGIETGSIRLCPVCDGFEVINQRVAVVGPAESALQEAEFLLRYTPHVTMLVHHPDDPGGEWRQQAARLKIQILDTVGNLVPATGGYNAVQPDGTEVSFDVIYPAMGCRVQSGLVAGLGVRCDDDGYVVVDQHQCTSVEGIYAIGDVARPLNQIAVAFGQGAIAATHIHNSLSAQS